VHKDQKTGPSGSTARIASGLSIMELNTTHGYCQQILKVCSPPAMSLRASHVFEADLKRSQYG